MRRLILVALVCLALPPVPARAANARVSMAEVRFQPPEVHVSAGGTVTWSNDDSMAHDVTADDGSFKSSPTCEAATGTGCLAPGDTWPHTFGRALPVPLPAPRRPRPGYDWRRDRRVAWG